MVFKTIMMDSPGAHAFAPSLANAKLASGVKPVMPTFTFGEPPPGPVTVPTTSSKERSVSGDVSEYVKKSNPSCEMAPLTRLFVAVITKLKVPAVREISPVIVPPSKSHGLLMQVSMINGIAEACAGKKANKPSVKATGGRGFTDSSSKCRSSNIAAATGRAFSLHGKSQKTNHLTRHRIGSVDSAGAAERKARRRSRWFSRPQNVVLCGKILLDPANRIIKKPDKQPLGLEQTPLTFLETKNGKPRRLPCHRSLALSWTNYRGFLAGRTFSRTRRPATATP